MENKINYFEPINGSSEIEFNCSAISATNKAAVVTQWAILDMKNTVLYMTGHHSKNDSTLIDLSKIENLEPNTQIRLKAIVEAGDDSTNSVVLIYMPDGNTANYELSGTAFKTTLKLVSFSPTVFKCSSICGYNKSFTVVQWAFYDINDTSRLYQSDSYDIGKEWCVNLADVFWPGDKFYLKVIVTMGEDIQSSIILEHEPNSNTTAYFGLTGNSFDNALTFYGSIDPQLCSAKDSVENLNTNTSSSITHSNLHPEKQVNSKPVIQCYDIYVTNEAWVVTKWQIINAQTNVVIVESGPCKRDEIWSLHLGDLSLVEGTQVYLKAAVEAGSDSISTVNLAWNYSDGQTAVFVLTGTTIDTNLIYDGVI